jgi:hypothetical protein
MDKDRAALHMGWLHKQGHFFTNWKHRHFSVQQETSGVYLLKYFKKEGFSEPQGTINLLNATLTRTASDDHPFGFSVTESDCGKTTIYPLRACSHQDRSLWLETLGLLIAESSKPAKAAISAATDIKTRPQSTQEVASQRPDHLISPKLPTVNQVPQSEFQGSSEARVVSMPKQSSDEVLERDSIKTPKR